ncbi:hypothetical protein BC567DRAFT_268366 [Phyllosticta citribraziliensis]
MPGVPIEHRSKRSRSNNAGDTNGKNATAGNFQDAAEVIKTTIDQLFDHRKRTSGALASYNSTEAECNSARYEHDRALSKRRKLEPGAKKLQEVSVELNKHAKAADMVPVLREIAESAEKELSKADRELRHACDVERRLNQEVIAKDLAQKEAKSRLDEERAEPHQKEQVLAGEYDVIRELYSVLARYLEPKAE